MQRQMFVSVQEQERIQLQKDCFILIDIIHRTISSAEKYALGNSQYKKYGFWDELDTSNYKNEEELKFEFSMKIQTVIGSLQEFNKLYPSVPIPFYDKIPKEMILKDLEDYKTIILSNKKKCKDAKLYDMLINILNGKKYNLMSTYEVQKYYSTPLKKDEILNSANEIFQGNIYSGKGVKKATEELQHSQNYQPGELGINPGRGYNQ